MNARLLSSFRRVSVGRSPRKSTDPARTTTGRRHAGTPRLLVPFCVLAATVGLVVAGGAVAQDNGIGKVLVFTGTDGAPNASTAAAVEALEGIGAANDFTVDVSAAAGDINAGNLDDYRAVVFVHSAGDVLDASQAQALEDYVTDGGGFLGIGETANLQPGNSFFDQLIGSRPSGSSAEATAQDVEFLDRTHPATRDLPALHEAHEDLWYEWSPNPTGSVHTVARARFGSIPTGDEFSADPPEYVEEVNILDEGASVTDDAIKASGASPNVNRAVSWCRDIQHGRSFYTAMGRVEDAYDADELVGHLEGALHWAAGTIRGDCKATINSNYEATRLTPPNPTGTHDFIGEAVDLDIADDGLVFVIGRARCAGNSPQNTNWNHPEVGLGCGTLHVWDPGVEGDDNQNPDKVDHVHTFEIFGQKGGGAEVGATSKAEQGLTAIALDPEFTEGRPYIYLDYYPWHADELGPGFHRPTYMGERRLSRVTYDFDEKSLVEGSERVIFHYMTQMYACCHAGGSMRFDSEGNLHVPGGDYVGNSPNQASGGYANPHPGYTVPAEGDPPCTLNEHRDDPNCGGGVYSFGDARTSSGSTANYDGSMYRIRPLDNPGPAPKLAPSGPGTSDSDAPWAELGPGQAEVEEGATAWGLGSTYALPGEDSPNGANMFAPDSAEVQSGLAKPEIYSIGMRNHYSVEIDPATDLITGASVGPDQNAHSNFWGLEGHSAHVIMPEAGNYLGWPFCWGNQLGYRKKLAAGHGGGAGGHQATAPAPVGTPGTIPGPPFVDGEPQGGWINCYNPILNDSPFNEGIEHVPPPKPVNFWWGRSNLGCPDYRRDQNLLPFNFVNAERFERCPFARKIGGGGQAGMTGPIYRVPDGAESPWPAYWDGRWFLFNYSSPNTTRHAVLLPDNPDNTSQAIAADSLVGIMTPQQIGNNAFLGAQFGPDGSLYALNYGQGFFILSNNTALWRYSYTGGPATPNPDPQAESAEDGSREVEFSIGRSGGVAYEWDFGDGNSSTEANPTHAYQQVGDYEATLTVTYADGEEVSETVDVTALAEVPVNTEAPELRIIGRPNQPVVGAQLRCDPGKWTAAGNYQFTWKRDGEEFTPTEPPRRHDTGPEDAGTTITCEVTRTNRNAVSEVAVSNPIAISGG